MRQQKLSYLYTTRLNQVITINCEEESKSDRDFLDSLKDFKISTSLDKNLACKLKPFYTS